MERDVDVVHRGRDRGMLGAPARDARRKGARRQPVDRHAPGASVPGLDADHLPVERARGDVVGFGGEQLRSAGGEPRFRLRHVGARHLAGVEAVARLPQLHFEHDHVAALQLEDRRSRAADSCRRWRASSSTVCSVVRSVSRAAKTWRLALPGAVAGLEPVEEGLVRGQAEGLDTAFCAYGSGVERRRRAGLRLCQRIDMRLGKGARSPVTRGR